MRPPARLLAIFLLAASSAAYAHPGHGASGFAAGLAHPILGPDHLLAMAAVGLWAAQGGGSRMWLLPAAFMAALAAGAAAAIRWQAAVPLDAGIAASVLALGLLVAQAGRLPAPASAAIAAAFGLLHGYAHGLELPQSAAPVDYALGFLAATAALHLCGLAMGAACRERHRALVKTAGVAIAAGGAYLLAYA